MTETLARMKNLGVKQTAMIKALRKHGIKVYPSQLSNYLNDVMVGETAQMVLNTCNEILDSYEQEIKNVSLV